MEQNFLFSLVFDRNAWQYFDRCSLLSLIEVSRDSEIIESFNTDARCAVLTGSMLRQTMKDVRTSENYVFVRVDVLKLICGMFLLFMVWLGI